MPPSDLESMYAEARGALKAREYDAAAGLLRQILVADENYKDASRLLAESVRLKRRKWYGDPRLAGAAGAVIVIGLGIFLAPNLRASYSSRGIASSGSPVAAPQAAGTSAAAPLPEATTIPLKWQRIAIGQELPRDLVDALAFDPKDQDVLYIRMQYAGTYKSIDGGVSWQPVQLANIPAAVAADLWGQSGIDESLSYSGRGEYILFNTAGGIKRLYKTNGWGWSLSEDNGSQWRQFSGQVGDTQHSGAITFDRDGAVYIYCAPENLCKYSPDGRQRWTLGNPDVGPFTLIALSPHAADTIYVAGEGLAVSTDAGLTWTRLYNGLGGGALQLDAGSGEVPVLYAETGECLAPAESWRPALGYDGFPLYRSTDGGKSWETSLETGCYLIQDADKTTLYRIGRIVDWDAPNWIWRSSDQGKTWRKLPAPSYMKTLVADENQSGLLYLYRDPTPWRGTYGGEEYLKSTDYGRTWEKLLPAPATRPCYGSTPQFISPQRAVAIDPFDGNHVLYFEDHVAVMDGGSGVYREQALMESHDSCGLTSPFETPPPGKATSIAFDQVHAGTWYAGTDRGACVSFDEGLTWAQINDGLLGVELVYSIATDATGGVFAATPYGIFKLEGK